MALLKPIEDSAESLDARKRELSDCIVAVARDRDRDAFAALFTHFAPRVKTYLCRHGASGALAEELAQETLLTVWHKAAFFDPARAGAATWIFTIARNLRIDVMRRERYPADVPDWAVMTSPDSPGEDVHVARGEQEHLVAQAMRKLPAEQAEVLRLAFFDDKSHADIERCLGLPLGTVKSRLRLALRRLRLDLTGRA